MSLAYHMRAARYSQALWATHLEGVTQFLNGFRPSPRLILVGPSGGYSLPLEFLASFEIIQVIEPDPVARFVFVRRFWSIREKLNFHAQNLNFEKLNFLEPYEPQGAAVLFCNVLGQVRVGDEKQFQRALRAQLQDLKWASFHDRFSASEMAWKTPIGPQFQVVKTDPTLVLRPQEPTLQEHLASDAIAELEPKRIHYWDWQISPKQIHLIEGLASI